MRVIVALASVARLAEPSLGTGANGGLRRYLAIGARVDY
jgi:hypothetical protein